MSTEGNSGAYQLSGENVPRGILLTILSVMVFGIQDSIAKILVQDYAVPQIVMIRYWAFALFSFWLVSRQARLRSAFKSKRPFLQILRGLLLLGDIVLFATAVRTVPLGELSAIMQLVPVLVTMFAILLLGEKVGLIRWVSIFAGFVGALIIIRPGMIDVDPGVFFALGAVVGFSLYTICTRLVAQEDSTSTSMFYVAIVGMVLSTAVGIFFWQPIAPESFGLFAVLLATTAGGHFLIIRSLAYAPASVIQPFTYLSLPWAITLSFIVFGHLIDFISLVGAMIIVGAGLVVWMRERKKKADLEAQQG